MEVTFGIINLALVNKSPKVLNLKQLMNHYIAHRRVVIRRRTQFDLDKALRRAHILEGFKIAFKYLDEIIKTIRASKTTLDAKESLIKKFDLSEAQAQAILEMQLQRLAALERDKIEEEYQQLLKDIDNYRGILASDKRVDAIIKEELAELKKKYADERRTEIAGRAEDIEIEDMIADEDMAITISNKGYVKRLSIDGYRSQKRGGKGVTAMTTSDEDFVERMFVASSKDFLLIFSNAGTVRWLKVYEIPVASRTARGKAIVNLLSFKPEEKISAIVAVKEFREDQFLVFATKMGLVKKTKVSAYNNPRKGGIVGIGVEKGDELISVALSNGKEDVLLATREGISLRFSEKQLRDMGRSAKGVRGINLHKGDFVVGMLVFAPDVDKTSAKLLSVCELGYAKRSDFAEYRTQSRGGKGIINVKITEKNGAVVGIMTVSDGDEIMAVTKQGMVVRSSPSEIRETGRSAVGVRLIALEKDDRLSSIAHLVSHEEG
jgi:DNA gyrase subunit A